METAGLKSAKCAYIQCWRSLSIRVSFRPVWSAPSLPLPAPSSPAPIATVDVRHAPCRVRILPRLFRGKTQQHPGLARGHLQFTGELVERDQFGVAAVGLLRVGRRGSGLCDFGRGHVGHLLWFGTDISIKTGSGGLSGQIPEILIAFHQGYRERGHTVGEDIFIIIAPDLEGVAMAVHIDVDDFVRRIDHVDNRAGE